MIKFLKLNNFAAFSGIRVDFSPRVNVIIGENSTGKTQLMKAAYALLSASHEISGLSQPNVQKKFTDKILRVMDAQETQIGNLWRHGSKEKSEMEIGFDEGWTRLGFNYNSRQISVNETTEFKYRPIFIPTKEVLSILRGLKQAEFGAEIVKRIYDDTHLDLCKFLSKEITQPVDKRLNTDPRFGSVYPKIVDAIDGRYEFSDGNVSFQQGEYLERKKRFDAKHASFYSDATEYKFTATEDISLSSSMTAEGHRKIGIIQQLLANESLSPQICGCLFWDEPESNLNPKLMRTLVETLLELSRNGLQIIIATHDYTTLKWFDLLSDKNKEDHVRYHSLYRDDESWDIRVHSTDNYDLIKPNAIANAFSSLLDHEIAESMGGLGK